MRFLPPPRTAHGSVLERWVSRIVAWISWAVLAALGLVFLLSLLVWLMIMVVFSLVRSLFTGRPATVTLLWQRYREAARQRWPEPPSARTPQTPRADAAQATGASRDTGVQDVRWRDVPASGDESGD